MSELFREIEEDIKRERFEKIWRKVGRFAVWGSVAIILATSGFVIYDNYKQSKAEENTSKLLKAISLVDSKNYKEAVADFSKLSENSDSSYSQIVMLQKAEAQELGGDVEGAKKTYADIAKINKEFAGLAKLKAASDNEKIETSSEQPFYHTVAEYNAWNLLGSGKKDEAVSIFTSLVNDPDTPASIVARAREALHFISTQKSDEKKAGNE